jgi:hypothetical protein
MLSRLKKNVFYLMRLMIFASFAKIRGNNFNVLIKSCAFLAI